MEMNQPSKRIHPLMAGAAVSVMLVSLLGVAAITGVLPNSHSTAAPVATAAAPVAPATAPAEASAQYAAPVVSAPVVHRQRAVHHAAPAYGQAAPAPQYAQATADNGRTYQQPAQQQAAAPTSGVGIATGAVIGGLLGNQVGGGNGRTLATIAGVVGGGFLGNEAEKRAR